jgi:uncharacterized membrane protein YfbV (UPF0208 family)
MSSSRTGSFVRSAFIDADESTGGVPLAVGDPGGALACAVAAIERAGQEIEFLWRHSMTAADPGLSERFAEVSHALKRAGRVLEHDAAIG